MNRNHNSKRSKILRQASTLLILLLAITEFTACSPCCVPVFKPKCCLCGRRPQVMVTWEDYVWDYNQICPVEDYMDQQDKQCEVCDRLEKCQRKLNAMDDCNSCGCKGDCNDSCNNGCEGACGDSCDSDCTDTCAGKCSDTCADSCGKTCNDTCDNSCGDVCNDTCDNSCENSCAQSCSCRGRGGIMGELPEDAFSPIRASGTYTFSPGDVMDIGVFGDRDTYVESVVVPPDGKLYYTFLDGLKIDGKTVKEVQNEIADNLQDLFLDPMVSIAPRELANKTFKIMGRVSEPGIYLLQGPTRLREGIGLAGGILKEDTNYQDRDTPLESTANFMKSYVVRDGKKLPVDFKKLLYDGDESQNIYLRPGDFIYLYPQGLREVYVLGSVFGPGRVEWRSNMTLSNAIASVGGFELGSPFSPDLTKFIIIRGKMHCPCVMCVNFKDILNGRARDVYLAPGDVIYASHKQMRFGRELVRIAINSFVNSFVVGISSYYSFTEWFPRDISESETVIE